MKGEPQCQGPGPKPGADDHRGEAQSRETQGGHLVLSTYNFLEPRGRVSGVISRSRNCRIVNQAKLC
jgi:hypothetical protein